MKLSMIVALGRNRVIGIDNVMPWHIPADLRYFRSQTMGKPVVMGRKTLESIGKPLGGRHNFVVTRDRSFSVDGVTVLSNLDEAVASAEAKAIEVGVDEIMIIGGGQIYEQLIDRAERLYLTEIDLSPEGHAHFPDYRKVAEWDEVWREHHPKEGDAPAFDFVTLERR